MFDEDRRLVQRLVAGDQRAFRSFFDRYAGLLTAFIQRRVGGDPAVAEDLLQNSMMRALKYLPGYRADASLYTWLCQICRSEIADQRRRSASRVLPQRSDVDIDTAGAWQELVADAALEPAQQLAAVQQLQAVVQVLEGLPGHYAQLLELKYGHDMAVDEIASHLGMSATAVQSTLARARTAFRAAWQAGGQLPPDVAPGATRRQ